MVHKIKCHFCGYEWASYEAIEAHIPCPEDEENAVTYEGKMRGKWLPISFRTWRSYCGERRKDGKLYTGPVYFLGTTKISRTEPKSATVEAYRHE